MGAEDIAQLTVCFLTYLRLLVSLPQIHPNHSTDLVES